MKYRPEQSPIGKDELKISKMIHVMSYSGLIHKSVFEAFRKYGTIFCLIPAGDQDCFVTMNDRRDAQDAYNALNGCKIGESTIKLNFVNGTNEPINNSDYDDMMHFVMNILNTVKTN